MIARGFSLLEIMLVLVLVALMLSLGFPLWQHQMRRMHVGEARLALLYNARFLESRLTERQQYAGGDQAWPKLPISHTSHYQISFSSNIEYRSGRYRLKAIALDPANSVYLLMDQDGWIVECNRNWLSQEICTEGRE
jgi:type IV pilus assembly protein PilE